LSGVGCTVESAADTRAEDTASWSKKKMMLMSSRIPNLTVLLSKQLVLFFNMTVASFP
jgi:hypothetical protein